MSTGHDHAECDLRFLAAADDSDSQRRDDPDRQNSWDPGTHDAPDTDPNRKWGPTREAPDSNPDGD
jgi:hypothetical protein